MQPALPPAGTCGNPGLPRARTTVALTALLDEIAYVIMDQPGGGVVFVIDDFRIERAHR